MARVASDIYPDPTQFDPASPYFDPKSKTDAPRWLLRDVQALQKTRLIGLPEGAPDWVHLLPAGEIRTCDGRGPYRVPDAARTFAGMKARGVLVKNISALHPLLANCLRITVGTPDENTQMLAAFTAALQESTA